jgi:heme/copper-type cytochrome/quinol oxidase subunit 3
MLLPVCSRLLLLQGTMSHIHSEAPLLQLLVQATFSHIKLESLLLLPLQGTMSHMATEAPLQACSLLLVLLLLLLLQGTMSHMAPEALLHGCISKAADVYAYGVTLWELFTGGQAYQGAVNLFVFGSMTFRCVSGACVTL